MMIVAVFILPPLPLRSAISSSSLSSPWLLFIFFLTPRLSIPSPFFRSRLLHLLSSHSPPPLLSLPFSVYFFPFPSSFICYPLTYFSSFLLSPIPLFPSFFLYPLTHSSSLPLSSASLSSLPFFLLQHITCLLVTVHGQCTYFILCHLSELFSTIRHKEFAKLEKVKTLYGPSAED